MTLLHEHRAFIVLLALAALLFTNDVRSWREFVRAESYFAVGARLMVEEGDWLTPHAPDEQPLNKPPLTYWLIGICYKLFGPGYGAARLPSVLAALATLTIVYATGQIFYGRRVGLTSAALLATSTLFLSFARIAMSDMLLALWVTASIASFSLALDLPNKQNLIFAGYLALALGVLTKGPVAVALVGLPIAAQILFRRRPGDFKKLRLGTGVILVFVIAAPYFVAVALKQGTTALWFFFVGENLQRFSGHLYSELARPSWYQLMTFFGDFAPWSVIILVVLSVDCKCRGNNSPDQMKKTCYLWLGLTILLFSISSFKRDYYLLPAMPAAALIVGKFLGDHIQSDAARRLVSAWLVLCGCLVLGVASAALRVAAIIGAHSIFRFAPLVVATIGLMVILWLWLKQNIWVMSVILSAVIAVTFVSLELALVPAFTRFMPAVEIANSTRDAAWITSHKASDWANDIVFNLTPPRQLERITVAEDTERLLDFLSHSNTVALIVEEDLAELQLSDPSLRILQRVESFGHGGLRTHLLRRPARQTLLVVGH